jgi:hypothetical protein
MSSPSRNQLKKLGLFGNLREKSTYGGSGKKPVAFQVEINALKEMLQIGYAIGASLEYLDLIVEAFNKAAGFTIYEVIQDLIPPTTKCVDKAIKAA